MGEFRNRHTRELLGQEERALSRLRGRVGWGGLHSRYVGGSSFAAPARSVVGSVLEAGTPTPALPRKREREIRPSPPLTPRPRSV